MSDRHQSADRHADTHDVRREAHTNPTGPEPEDPSFAEQMAPMDIGGGHAGESTPAAADKRLHERLSSFTSDELDRLPILEPGTRLEQGGTYLNLNDLASGPFKAIGGHEATKRDRIVAKRDADYVLWNRLVGDDDEPELEPPEPE